MVLGGPPFRTVERHLVLEVFRVLPFRAGVIHHGAVPVPQRLVVLSVAEGAVSRATGGGESARKERREEVILHLHPSPFHLRTAEMATFAVCSGAKPTKPMSTDS